TSRGTLGGGAHRSRRGAGPRDAAAAGRPGAPDLGAGAVASGQPAFRLCLLTPQRRSPSSAKQLPPWLTVQSQRTAPTKPNCPGRLRTDTPPDRLEWQVKATVAVDWIAVTHAVQRKAAFLVATTILPADHLADRELIQAYKDQHSVEGGFSFLKDPLF